MIHIRYQARVFQLPFERCQAWVVSRILTIASHIIECRALWLIESIMPKASERINSS